MCVMLIILWPCSCCFIKDYLTKNSCAIQAHILRQKFFPPWNICATYNVSWSSWEEGNSTTAVENQRQLLSDVQHGRGLKCGSAKTGQNSVHWQGFKLCGLQSLAMVNQRNLQFLLHVKRTMAGELVDTFPCCHMQRKKNSQNTDRFRTKLCLWWTTLLHHFKSLLMLLWGRGDTFG